MDARWPWGGSIEAPALAAHCSRLRRWQRFSRSVFEADHLVGADIVAWSTTAARSCSIRNSREEPPWGVMQSLRRAAVRRPWCSRAPAGFDLSPDGSRIAYSANESANELWALDNVLPGSNDDWAFGGEGVC